MTSDVAGRLAANSPYKVEVASSDGTKVLITHAYTLERRRLWERPSIGALAFSPDGLWLYAVTHGGEVVAIDSDAGTVVPVGRIPVQAGERVVDAVGLGPADSHAVSIILARPQGQAKPCVHWSAPRRVVLRRPAAGGGAQLEVREGWPDDQRNSRTAVISPNTRFKAMLEGPAVTVEGRAGQGTSAVSRIPLPAGAFHLDWMRDSSGLAVFYPRLAEGACRARLGARFFRQEQQGWSEWTLPDHVALVRGDQSWPMPVAAADGMRWLGVEPRGVVLIEPAPRFRPRVALIAPPSVVWPKLRPGTRALAAASGGALRLVELLLETGDLDAASAELEAQAAKASPLAVAKLRGRLAKLQEVRLRRAQELGLTADEVRSLKGQPLAPAAERLVEEEALDPAQPVTPSQSPTPAIPVPQR